jgi:hypothetical protein
MGNIKGAKLKVRQPRAVHLRLASEVVENAKRKEPLTNGQLLTIAGYAKGTIRGAPFQPFTSQGFQTALRNIGATEERLASVINDAMQAKAGNWYKGEHTESEHADHAIRLRASEQLAELTGAKITRIELKSVNIQVDKEDLMGELGI